MAKAPSASDIAKTIQKMREERAQLQGRLAEIEDFFASIGLSDGAVSGGAVSKPRVGRPPKAVAAKSKPAGKKRGRRGSFGISGDESVYQFIKNNGPVTAAQVNKHWQAEGRGGKADNSLSKLVKDGRLVRKNIEGARGSNYTAK
jgi:hypothetical protein